MKLSELIESAQKTFDEFGDIEVAYQDQSIGIPINALIAEPVMTIPSEGWPQAWTSPYNNADNVQVIFRVS